jgi:GGDEF domain-containing protein
MNLEPLLVRLLLLHEVATGYTNLSLAHALAHAQHSIGWIFEHGQLKVLDPASVQGFPTRGRVAGGYGALFFGPPRPMYLLLEIPNIDDPTELRLAALFCDYLLSALYAAGYREELERQARYDWLTGLGNRRALERRLADGLPSDWGLAFLDLDNLKIVNDSQGHLAGDRLLQYFADSLRQSGFEAYRLGGDEFAVLLTKQQLEKLYRAIAGFQVSYGLAWAEEGDGMVLVTLADERMYEQKRRKKALH